MPAQTLTHKQFKRGLMSDRIGPGTYWVEWPSGVDVCTVPSRTPEWVRSSGGELWHRVRYVEIRWTSYVRRQITPRITPTLRCGPSFTSDQTVSLFADEPQGPVCKSCAVTCGHTSGGVG